MILVAFILRCWSCALDKGRFPKEKGKKKWFTLKTKPTPSLKNEPRVNIFVCFISFKKSTPKKLVKSLKYLRLTGEKSLKLDLTCKPCPKPVESV